MLAKGVGRSVSIIANEQRMDSARAILQLQASASEEELLATLQRLTVQRLKFLCKESAVKSSGIKAEIIGRLVTSWKKLCDVQIECAGDEQQGATSSNDVQGTSKSTQTAKSRNPNFETIRQWTKDISPIRGYWFMKLYQYLINSTESTFDKESMKAFKSLKAYKYFADGLVRNVWAHHFEDRVVVRGYCLSSLKAKTTYTVYVVIKTNGDVVGGACNCIAGKGEACSHVAAVLFYLDDLTSHAITTLPTDETVTGRPQQWHKPPKRDVDPKPLSAITFHKDSYGKTRKEPHHEKKEQAATLDDAALETLVTTIKASCPTSGLCQFWSTQSSEQTASTAQPMVNAMHEGLMRLTQKLIVFDGSDTSLPPSAVECQGTDTDSEYFKEVCCEYEKEQVIDDTLSAFVEQNTTGQSECQLWKMLHNGRLTSSIVGEIMHRRDSTNPDSILRRIMGYTKMTGTPLAIQWGKAKETVARDAKMRSLGHKGLHCQMTGLTLLPCHSYLGASSDGLILNHRYHEDKGVLEIKCPYSVEKNPTYNLPLMDIARTYSQQFFLEEIENAPKLKRSSNYYYQVQAEMAIMGCKWCHFVVWTEVDIFVEEIAFDERLWRDTVFPKLQSFYLNVIVPEILTRRVQQSVFV